MFFNTLKAPYYDQIIGNLNTNFSDVVSAGEMIESGVKLGKIEGMEAKKSTPKKKEGETHAVSYQGKTYNHSYSRQPDSGYQSYNQYVGGNRKRNYQPNVRPAARFPALPHQYRWWLLNQRANKEIMLKEQGLSKKGPNLTLSQ